MRRITREALAVEIQASLDEKQAAANQKHQEGNLQVETEWQNALADFLA